MSKISIFVNAGECHTIKCLTNNEGMCMRGNDEYQAAFNRINFNNSKEKATNIEEIEKIIYVDNSTDQPQLREKISVIHITSNLKSIQVGFI